MLRETLKLISINVFESSVCIDNGPAMELMLAGGSDKASLRNTGGQTSESGPDNHLAEVLHSTVPSKSLETGLANSSH